MDDGFAVIYWACGRVVITAGLFVDESCIARVFWRSDAMDGLQSFVTYRVRPRVIPDGSW